LRRFIGAEYTLTCTPASDQSLLVSFGDVITPEAHAEVVRLLRMLEADPIDGVRNLHPAYCSLLIRFDPLRVDHEILESAVRDCVERFDSVVSVEPRTIEIPIRYGDEFGPDLENVAKLHSISPENVVELHASATYTVYFLGFVPGFAYLGGLPEKIATPRLQTPRKQVPRGSLGIAGNQTGIYPCSTPGGWQIIGRTPLEMFRPNRENMSLLSIGDRVRFVPLCD
jgi:inhibitor of KinA